MEPGRPRHSEVDVVSGAVLTFAQLHVALERCMQAHPPEGIELRLHTDANAMAGLWGLMSYERRSGIPMDDVKPSVLAAYRRWTTAET